LQKKLSDQEFSKRLLEKRRSENLLKNKKQIKIEINQNINNICIGPIILQKTHHKKEEKLINLDQNLSENEIKPLSKKFREQDRKRNFSHEPEKNAKLQNSASQPKISLKICDEFSKLKAKIIEHNFACIFFR